MTSPTQRRYPFALYDAFSTGGFGGATAGIVENAADLDPQTMQSIAREIAAPATAFVLSLENGLIESRFFSTVTELGMCGHGTVALTSHLLEIGQLELDQAGTLCTTLRTSAGDARLRVRRGNEAPLVMLELAPSRCAPVQVDLEGLSRVLGLSNGGLEPALPIETASGAFTHLLVPLKDLATMKSLRPDFPAIARFSVENGVDTVTVFTLDVEHELSTVHLRDFCPAVGTPESAGAGTTNAALSTYLARHNRIGASDGGTTVVLAEQGYECGRPSEVRSELGFDGSTLSRLAVGGRARKSLRGEIFVPLDDIPT